MLFEFYCILCRNSSGIYPMHKHSVSSLKPCTGSSLFEADVLQTDPHGPLTRYVKLRVPLVIGTGMHHGTCVTHVPWCMSGTLTRGGGETVPGVPGACTTLNFTLLVGGPCSYHTHLFMTQGNPTTLARMTVPASRYCPWIVTRVPPDCGPFCGWKLLMMGVCEKRNSIMTRLTLAW